MTEKLQEAPLLRPLITKQGLLAAIEASTLGKAVKIVQVGLTATPGIASDTDTTLPGAQILDSVDGRVVNDHQVNVSVLLPDTFPSLDIAGIGFYLEDGTLFALYREEAPFLEHTAGTTLLVGMDLVMDNIPSESVIVESTGANLILGDWVPVERKVNGYALTQDIDLTAEDVGALSKANGGTISAPIFFSDSKKYISQAGSTLYIASLLGKVVLEGVSSPMVRIAGKDYEIIHTGNFPTTDLSGYVKTSRKINNKALTADITLDAADVNAVGKTGAQTMQGQLNGVKFTVTDNYAIVSRLRAQHGLYLGNHANDKRTILGGGGDEVGDASGSIILRPNGITDTAGATTFNPDGTITNGAEPAAGSHLTNKTYVDKVVKVVNDLFGNYLPLLGGVMKGAILAHAIKSAIKVNDKGSISFQDGANTMFHLFSEGNAFRFRHGNNGENGIVSLYADQVDVHRTLYARTGVISQNSTGSRWLSMETPESGNPYLAARASGDANPVKVLEFDNNRIRARKTLHADSMQVQSDAGLKFAPNDDRSGLTWGMGINDTTRELAIHSYHNGAWNWKSLWIGSDNVVQMYNLKVSGGAVSSYSRVDADANPLVELHQPGNSAVIMYKPTNAAALRIARSNGAGGEAEGYAQFETKKLTVLGQVETSWENSRNWHSWNHAAFSGGNRNGGEGALFGLLTQRYFFDGSYDVEMFHGVQTHGDLGQTGHTFACQGYNYLQVWTMRNHGQLESPGGWYISSTGDLYSPRLGGTNIVDWTISNFAGKRAADGNYDVVSGSYHAIGAYVLAAAIWGAGQLSHGQHMAGANLRPTSCYEYGYAGYSLPGTWMCMGDIQNSNGDDRLDDRATLWMRVA